jgi:hypothetical protein
LSLEAAASAAAVAAAVALNLAASSCACVYDTASLELESSLDPHAASDRAIKETPPALADLVFFFSQAVTSLLTSVSCLPEASISFRNAPVDIMFIFFAPYKTEGKVPCPIFSQLLYDAEVALASS